MTEWIPFFQTLFWVLLIAGCILTFRKNIFGMLSILEQRIKTDPLELPGGVSIGKRLEKIEQTTNKLAEDVHKGRTCDDWYIIGQVYRFQKKYVSSEDAFRNAINVNEKYIPAYLGLAYMFRDKSKEADSDEERGFCLSMALNNCGTAISINNKFWPSYMVRATIIHAMKGRFEEEAKTDLQKAIMHSNNAAKKFIPEEEEFKAYTGTAWFKPFIQ